jgi:hypothetical protein
VRVCDCATSNRSEPVEDPQVGEHRTLNDRVVVAEFAGFPVALSWDEFEAARRRAERMLKGPTESAAPTSSGAADKKLLMTPDECAQRSGTSRSWWIRAARRKEVACTRVGRYVRFTQEQFAAVLGNCVESRISDARAVQKAIMNRPVKRARNSTVTLPGLPRIGITTPTRAGNR